MTTDYYKWTAMSWLRNGEDLDIGIMHRGLNRLGFRVVSWASKRNSRFEDKPDYTLRLETNILPENQMIDRLCSWITTDWMWLGDHTIFVSCPGSREGWHYLSYTLTIHKRPGLEATATINEKID